MWLLLHWNNQSFQDLVTHTWLRINLLTPFGGRVMFWVNSNKIFSIKVGVCWKPLPMIPWSPTRGWVLSCLPQSNKEAEIPLYHPATCFLWICVCQQNRSRCWLLYWIIIFVFFIWHKTAGQYANIKKKTQSSLPTTSNPFSSVNEAL